MFDKTKFLNIFKFCLLLLFAAVIGFVFYEFLKPLQQFLVSIGVVIIVISSLNAIFDYISLNKTSGHQIDLIRYKLGAGILFGLELMVAADIIETVINPNYYDIGLLGLLIVIRSFLSYFLNKEIERLELISRQNIEK